MWVTFYLQILGALSLAWNAHAFSPLLTMRVKTPPSSLMAYPTTTFDGPAIAKHFNRRPWEVFSRLVTTTTPLGLWWLSVQCDNMMAPLLQRNEAAAQALRVRRGYELKQALCATGSVTFIKYGQALALRSDVVTVPEWAAALATLQDEVGAFDTRLAMQIIADDLHLKDPSQLFEWSRNDGQPVASASIGQVYRARIRGACGTTSRGAIASQNAMKTQASKQVHATAPRKTLRQAPQRSSASAQEYELEAAQARLEEKVQVKEAAKSRQLQQHKQGARDEGLERVRDQGSGKSEKEVDEVWEREEAWALEELRRRGIADLAGQEVALKVQRPDARLSAALDVYLLRLAGATLKKAKNLRSDLVLIVDTFGRQLFEELDYQQEARNAARFQALYGNGQIRNVKVPFVYPSLGSSRVIAMEWVDGEKGPWVKKKREDKQNSDITRKSSSSGSSSASSSRRKEEESEAAGVEDDREEALRMLSIGLQCSVRQVLRTGYFHADPHLGNLLRTPQGELCYLDFGMMADVPSKTRYGLVGLILGLQSQDLSLVAETLIDLGFLPDSLPSPASPLPPLLTPSPSSSSSTSPAPVPTPRMVDPQRGQSSLLDDSGVVGQQEWPSWAWPYDARYDVEATVGSTRGVNEQRSVTPSKEVVSTIPTAAAAAAAAVVTTSSIPSASAATSAALAVVLPALEQAFAAATTITTDDSSTSSTSSSSTSTSSDGVNLNFTRLSAELGALSAGPLPFRTPPFFALIVRTLAIYEGLAKQVDPSFVLIKGAFPWIAAEVLDSADNPDLQALLQKWLVDPKKGGRIRWSQLEKLLNLAAAAATSSSPTASSSSSSSQRGSSSYDALKSTQEAVSARRQVDSRAHESFGTSSTASSRSSKSSGSSSGSSSHSSENGVSGTNERGDPVVNRELEARLDAVELLLGFLLSPSGAFLLPALVEELADISEALGRSAARAPLQWLQKQQFSPLWDGFLPKEEARNGVVTTNQGQSEQEALEALGRLLFLGNSSSSSGGGRGVGDDSGELELQRLRGLASAAASVAQDPSRQVLRSQLATLTRGGAANRTESFTVIRAWCQQQPQWPPSEVFTEAKEMKT